MTPEYQPTASPPLKRHLSPPVAEDILPAAAQTDRKPSLSPFSASSEDTAAASGPSPKKAKAITKGKTHAHSAPGSLRKVRAKGVRSAAPVTSSSTPSPAGSSPRTATWTPAQKTLVMERVLAAGVSAINATALAKEVGVSTTQIKNALQKGRAGNLRDRAVKSATS